MSKTIRNEKKNRDHLNCPKTSLDLGSQWILLVVTCRTRRAAFVLTAVDASLQIQPHVVDNAYSCRIFLGDRDTWDSHFSFMNLVYPPVNRTIRSACEAPFLTLNTRLTISTKTSSNARSPVSLILEPLLIDSVTPAASACSLWRATKFFW